MNLYRVAAALIITLLVSGCSNNDAPIQVSVTPVNSGISMGQVKGDRIDIQSKIDHVEINQIVVNRGNCKLYDNGTRALAFGESTMYMVLGCDPIEVDVATDKGNWKFNFKSE
jgi:hypothetical protein